MYNRKLDDTGEGGQLSISYSDIATDEGLHTYIYESMFCGNEYWANGAFDTIDKSCKTEEVLKGMTISTAKLVALEQASVEDIGSDYGKVTASASIISSDRIKLEINIENTGNYSYIWNETEKMLTDAN